MLTGKNVKTLEGPFLVDVYMKSYVVEYRLSCCYL